MTSAWAQQCETTDFNGARCGLAAGHDGQHMVVATQAEPAVARTATSAGPAVTTGPNLAGAAIIIGGAILGVGAFLPWISLTAALVGTVTRSGMEGGDGWIVMALAAILVLSGVGVLRTTGPAPTGLRVLTLAAGAVALGLVYLEYQNVQERISGLESELQSLAVVGIGVYAMGAGAVIALGGGLAAGGGTAANAIAAGSRPPVAVTIDPVTGGPTLCPSCRAPQKVNRGYCLSCGKPYPAGAAGGGQPPEEPSTCPRCGMVQSAPSGYCPVDGVPFGPRRPLAG